MFYVYVKHRRDFENLLLYDRFVAVLKRILPILCCLLRCITGEVTGIQFVDSTPLEMCKAHVALDIRFFVELPQKVEQAPVGFMA
ncbi:hypothetical protein MIDIC_20001 [Alphaproteobacteria bacterium]